MILIRIFLLAFNVAVVTYLIYRLLQIYKSNSPNKNWTLGIGIFLLLVPVTMLMGFLKPTPIYLFISRSNFITSLSYPQFVELYQTKMPDYTRHFCTIDYYSDYTISIESP
ncbi:MAG: hypothetical protein U5K54_22870 [Cytophagales bacterium]|nr:hypothetical protein [Cytophagales bacterium]